MKETKARLQETFTELDSKAAGSLAVFETKLRKQVETWGMSSNEVALYKLELAGVSPRALEASKGMIKMIETLDEEKKAFDEIERRGKATFEETRKGSEKTRAAIADLNEELEHGVIDLETYRRKFAQIDPSVFGKLKRGINDLGFKGLAIGAAAGAAAIAGISAGLFAYGANALDAADQTGDLANQIGVSVQDLTRLTHATDLLGGSAESLGPALQKMNANFGDVLSLGITPTSKALERLGLDAQKVARMSAGDAFKAIAGGFEGIKDPATQASLAMDIFGKQGISLLNVLESGPEVIADFEKEADKLGITMTNADTEAAGAFLDSMNKLGAVFSGVGRSIAIEFAPVLTAVIESFTEFSTSAVNSGDLATGALEMFVGGLGVVLDGANALKTVGHAAFAGIIKEVAASTSSILLMGQGIEGLINLLPGVEVSFTSTFAKINKSLHELAGEQWEAAQESFNTRPSDSLNSWFEDVRSKAKDAREEINKTASQGKNDIESLSGLAEGFTNLRDKMTAALEGIGKDGKSPFLIEIENLKKGLSDEQFKELTTLEIKLKGAKEAEDSLKKMKDEAKAFRDKLIDGNPITKLSKELASFEKLRSAKLLTDDEANKLSFSASKEAGIDAKPKFAGAITANSQEGRSLALSYNNPQAKGIDTIAKNSSKQTDYLKTIAARFINVNTRTQQVGEELPI